MSSFSKKPVAVLEGVTVTMKDDELTVKGAQGTQTVKRLPYINITEEEGGFLIRAKGNHRQAKMNEGTMWSLLRNAIQGVAQGYAKTLEIEGIGFKAAVEGSTLVLNLGFSHPIKMQIPEGINVTVEKKYIKVSGINKEQVGQFAAEVRALKKPEPYKGKGIKYEGEIIRRKAGKKAAAA
ncbi:MAG: 50S ribosomal protein L6 [Anaplasmataceae bacterium]|nr:50S ribosomal protein L6 [Anaplasmataceae bacterium]